MLIESTYPWLKLESKSNALSVSPKDDLTAKYNWLKSSDRDTQMGVLSATNRRTLILTPGVYTLTSTWILDTNYVDIVSLSSNSKDTIVSRATGGATISQTANDVILRGFIIKNTGSASGDIGLEIAATDNSPSIYTNMGFSVTPYNGVYGTENIGGTWSYCIASGQSWRVAANKNLSAIMDWCVAGNSAFGGDAAGAAITGTLRHCIGGNESFGGCGTYGCNISGTLEDCIAGNKSYAMGMAFSGIAKRCIGGLHCFGGFKDGASYYGTFSGYAEDCIVKGGNSFGSGHASCKLSGQIINCAIGSKLASGALFGSTIINLVDEKAKATYTTAFAGANNDIAYTAKNYGKTGSNITIEYRHEPLSYIRGVYVTDYAILVKLNAGVSTAANVKNWLDAKPEVAKLVSYTYADGDGSGIVEVFGPTALSGGIDTPAFRNNHPLMPTACTANTTVRPYESGHTYTNEGALEDIMLSLPPAIPGFEYRFVVMVAYQLRIDPYGSETIAINGTQQDAGKYIWADAVGESCLLKCVKAGQWEQFDALGTWTAEA